VGLWSLSGAIEGRDNQGTVGLGFREVVALLLAALVNLNKRPYYIHWGVIQLSLANAIVIVLMVLVFAAAVLVPFPRDRGE
jgi:hypothetical protein